MKVQAILFDYGGTLDGGSHWLDRFLQLYHEAGLALSFDAFRAAFDYATHCAYADHRTAALGLQALVAFHVAKQMEQLRLTDTGVAATIVAAFVRLSRRGLEESRTVLERLRPRVALGVISNFYGNVDRILEEAGMAPLLATIVDSTCVGLSKPDPAIFTLAVNRLGCDPADVLYVGDSFEKDIVGAHTAGLRTAWLVGAGERVCPDPSLVDVRIRRLADLQSVIE